MPVRIPVVEMIEIGAGGGSIAQVDRLGRVTVGPQSAGSEPGPAAFGKGGTSPTVTDADVEQGLIDPRRFAEGRLTIIQEAATAALMRDVGDPLGVASNQAAWAVSEIVDESMASAGRMHAVESGKDLSARVMIAFGGNGPLHATRVARRTQVSRILIPRDPGVGSAVGFLFAPVLFEVIRSFYTTLDNLDVGDLNDLLAEMTTEADKVVRAGAPSGNIVRRRVAFMRYHGQGHEIEIELPNRPLRETDVDALKQDFETEYQRHFSRSVPGMVVEVLNWGVSVSSGGKALAKSGASDTDNRIEAEETRDILCDVTGHVREAGVFDRSNLTAGDKLAGPALIVEPQTTTFVSADFHANVDQYGIIWLIRNEETGE